MKYMLIILLMLLPMRVDTTILKERCPKITFIVNSNVSLAFLSAIELDLPLILAQSWVESSWRPTVSSTKGATGLMQIRQIAEDDVNERFGLDLDRFNIKDNLEIGSRYLNFLIDHYGYTLYEALRHYNGGWNWRNINSTHKYANRVLKVHKYFVNLYKQYS